MTVIEESQRKIPLSMPKTERHGHTLSDGSFVRVWVWDLAPDTIRSALNGRLKEPEMVVISPRACDQYSAKLFCECISTEFRHYGELDYEGVSCIAYITGRDG